MTAPRPLFYVLFLLSGFSGLIYESIWASYLKQLLGHAAYSQSLVVAIFMGGMAAGAAWTGRRDWANPLRAYALVEGCVGLFGLVFHPLFSGVTEILRMSVLPGMSSPELAFTVNWTSAALLILPQSVLLGMTFPLMGMGLLRRQPQETGAVLARLYFFNCLGGAAGVLASGFILIEALGLPGTIVAAGLLNLLVAGLAWRLADADGPVRALPPAAAVTAPGDARQAPRLLLLVAGLTGFSSLLYEMGWIRLLNMVLGSSTHSFELMLATFIAGLALGSGWVRRRMDDPARLPHLLGIIQVLMGCFALLTLPFYLASFPAMSWLLGALPKTGAGYIGFNLASAAIAAAIMLPAAFCAGMTLPLITAQLLRLGGGERGVGRVYATNTLGCILGAIFAVHLGFSTLGLKGVILLGALIDIALGAWLLLTSRPQLAWRTGLLAGAAVCIIATLALPLNSGHMASGIYRHIGLLPKSQVIEQRDGKTATIHVTLSPGGWMTLRTNGKADGGINVHGRGGPTPDEITMTMLGALPVLLRPQAQSVANIGFGTGMTAHVLLASPQIRSLDTIEIEQAVIEASRHFHPFNARAYTDPRSRIHIEDAKNFFSIHNRTFDIIISEPSNPWVSGISNLFSREFYATARRHLNDDGLFVQWLQAYEIDDALLASVLKAMAAEFPDYAVFATQGADLIIVASKNGTVPARITPQRIAESGLSADLARVGLRFSQDFEALYWGNRRLLHPWVEQFPLRANSDFYPVLDLHAPRVRFLDQSADGLKAVAQAGLPLNALLGGHDFVWHDERVTGMPMTLQALAAQKLKARLLYPALRVQSGVNPNAPEELRKHLAQLDEQVDACEAGSGPQSARQLLALAQALMKLSPEEYALAWLRVTGLPCASNPSLRDWVGLLQATGERNSRGMVHFGQRILEAPANDQTGFALAATLVAQRHLGQTADAQRLWQRHAAQVDRQALAPAVWALLEAHVATPAGPAR